LRLDRTGTEKQRRTDRGCKLRFTKHH
jgi:hypothetical protein